MNIDNGKFVSLSYVLRDTDESGELVEQTQEGQPLNFVFGQGMMLPKFEANLFNLSVGDDFKFQLVSEDAYGPVNPEAIVYLSESVFAKEDGKVDESLLFVGNVIPMQSKDGQRLMGRVVELIDGKVKMDFNPVMAGKDLHFSGKVLEVRDATEAELNPNTHGGGCGSDNCGTGSCDGKGGCEK